MDNGVLKSGWEFIMDRTDPRYVSAQIDIGWAVCGLVYLTPPTSDTATAQADVTRLINKFQSRIISFHVKDVVNLRPTCGNNDQRELGLGEINFAPMLRRRRTASSTTSTERDPVGIGGPTNFNPFTNAENSFGGAQGNPAPVLNAAPQSVPVRRRPARRLRATSARSSSRNDRRRAADLHQRADPGRRTRRRQRDRGRLLDRQPQLHRRERRRSAGPVPAADRRRSGDAGE